MGEDELTESAAADSKDKLANNGRQHANTSLEGCQLSDRLEVNRQIVGCAQNGCEQARSKQAGCPDLSLGNQLERNHGSIANTMLPQDEQNQADATSDK